MSYLDTIYPAAARWRLPLSRDQAILLMAAFNEIMLGMDTYLAHVLNQTIRPREWIPILFGPMAGVMLLVAGLIALRRRNLAVGLATAVFLASMIVGALGAWFHFMRGTLPSAPAGQQVTLSLLVWAPPILAPFAFAGVGLLGLSAAWQETDPDSGTLMLGGQRRLRMPYTKTQAYFFMVSLGTLVALVSSAWDHARTGFDNPWLWLPLAVGVFATFVPLGAGAIQGKLNRTELWTYVAAMLLLIATGVIGTYFHVSANLTATAAIVPERFLRGAPFMSPLLYANMGIIGLLILLPAKEK